MLAVEGARAVSPELAAALVDEHEHSAPDSALGILQESLTRDTAIANPLYRKALELARAVEALAHFKSHGPKALLPAR